MSRLLRPRREAGRRTARAAQAAGRGRGGRGDGAGARPGPDVGRPCSGPAGARRAAARAARGGPSQADIDRVMDEVRDELAESSEAMVRAAADLRLAESALPGAQATADHARALLAQARRRADAAARARGAAQVRLMLSSQTAEESAAHVAEQRAEIGRLARAAYQGGGSMGDMSMLLDARSPPTSPSGWSACRRSSTASAPCSTTWSTSRRATARRPRTSRRSATSWPPPMPAPSASWPR